jgi:hypothetical protein
LTLFSSPAVLAHVSDPPPNSGGTTNAFGTPDHDLHRTRRAPIARFFSHGMIAQLEGEVHSLVQQLCDRILAHSGKAVPFDVAEAYSCFTSDAISSYCFGESFGLLKQPGWTPNFREATIAVLRPVFYFRFFPVLGKLSKLGQRYVYLFHTPLKQSVVGTGGIRGTDEVIGLSTTCQLTLLFSCGPCT